MMMTDPNQITAQWLTQTLRESGSLPTGEVTHLRVAGDSSYTSNIAHLIATYSADAAHNAPARLWLKLARLDAQQSVVGAAQRQREVMFHTDIAERMHDAPIIHCYHAAFDEITGASVLLFEDVSQTHVAGHSVTPPDLAQGKLIMDAFAAWHAFWWDNPLLHAIGELPTPEAVSRDVEGIRSTWLHFAVFVGDRLTQEQQRIYERVLVALPRLMQRVTQGRNLTLIHGDAHMANVMLPIDSQNASSGKAVIIDWQLWGISYWAEDLSNLMALHWSRDQRQGLERDLLEHYYAQLVRHGVTDYSWAACWDDYRLAVITRVLFMPMWFWVTGAALDEVWRSLHSAMQAFEDLRCDEVLDAC